MTKLIFAGTPVFAAEILAGLIANDFDIVAVLTQPDRPAGRGQKLRASPVKTLALANNIPVWQPPSLKNADIQAELAKLGADAMIVAAYGLILPPAVLSLFPHGCINVHASLLPRWRGAAPIQRAILAGDRETGVGIMQMEAGLDTGPVYQQASITIQPRDTAEIVHHHLCQLGTTLLINTLPQIIAGTLTSQPQAETGITYAHKIEKTEAHIDWQQSAEVIDRQIRAFNPWPGAFTFLDGQLIKVWEALPLATTSTAAAGTIVRIEPQGVIVACGQGELCLTQVQPAGAKVQSAVDWQRGHATHIQPGCCLT